MLQILFDKISGMVSNILMLFDGLLEDTPVLLSIAIGLVLAMLSLSIFYFVQEQFFKITRLNTKGITLVDGVRDATRPLRIASNPNDINYIEMPRSKNEDTGLEFSYNIWFVINSTESDTWSHIFHKGSPNAYPLSAPSVFIKGNKVRVSMNTLNSIENKLDITGIPVKKWTMLTIILRGNVLDVYINGYLKNSLPFENDIPKLNDEPVFITNYSGFDGYISDLRYFNYAITGVDIKNLFEENPSTDSCSVGFDVPPYLDSNSMEQPEQTN